MSKRKSNKKVRKMMASVFNGEWESLGKSTYRLVVIEGYLGSWPVLCALHKTISLTANQLRGEL